MPNESYSPVFSKLVHSSLWSEPDHVRIVFITMLALKDSNQIVWGSAFALGEAAKKTEAEVIDALKILSKPDRKRIEKQPYDGRRIEKVEGGWLVLNGAYYQQMMAVIARRAYKAAWERDNRKRKKGKPLIGEVKACDALENGDVATFDRLAAPPDQR